MNSIKPCCVWCCILLFYCCFFFRINNANFCFYFIVIEMTISIISWILHTNCDLIILKHLIGENGQQLFFLFLGNRNNCIFYFIFKWKEENIQAHVGIIFLLRATTVHMFMFAITIQHMNTESALYHDYCWSDGLGLSTHCCHVHTKQKHPGNKPPDTYLSVHNNATTLGKYILYTSFISTFISPRCKSPLLNTKQRANEIYLWYIYIALHFVLFCFVKQFGHDAPLI